MTSKLNPYMNYNGSTGNNNTNEQSLIDGFITEAIQHNGVLLHYIPRCLNKLDELYGEDVISSFNYILPIEGYIETVDSFEGDSEIVAAFDIMVKDTIKIRFSRSRFIEEANFAAIKNRPLEGDLIYLPMAKALFEIKFLEDENQFYPNGMLPSYLVTAEKFDYSMEDFSTGEFDIDSISELSPATTITDDFGDNSIIEKEADILTAFNTTNPFGTF